MQNYHLLRALGQIRKPVLLKRGMSATIQEWLLASEYILSGGNYDVILCERGIRTFETYTRNTLDISAIPVIDKLSHLPIIADPSHAVGRRDKVRPLARAIVAAGADGVLIEVHHDPENAVCDGPQSLYPEQFTRLMDELRIIVPAGLDAPEADPALGAPRRRGGQARGLVARSVRADGEGRLLLRPRHQRRQGDGRHLDCVADPLQAGRVDSEARHHRRPDLGRRDRAA